MFGMRCARSGGFGITGIFGIWTLLGEPIGPFEAGAEAEAVVDAALRRGGGPPPGASVRGTELPGVEAEPREGPRSVEDGPCPPINPGCAPKDGALGTLDSAVGSARWWPISAARAGPKDGLAGWKATCGAC